MKINTSSILIVPLLFISFGCGSKLNTTIEKKPEQNTIIKKESEKNKVTKKDEVQPVLASSNFTGTWSANVDSTQIIIVINSNGDVTIKMEGEIFQERLVKDKKNIFYLTDTITNQRHVIKTQGSIMTIIISKNEVYTFTRN